MNATSGEEKKVIGRILLLNAKILGLVMGLITGCFSFVITVWIVIQGDPGVVRYVELLGQYFIGYGVSLWGGVVGFAYGIVIGGASGVLIGWIYNWVVGLRDRQF
jgi:hypothetical protein